MSEKVAGITIPYQQNESAYWLAALSVQEGQAVRQSQVLARLEGQRNVNLSVEIASPAAGYVVGLHAVAGQVIHAGDTLCYICDQPSLPAAKPGSRISLPRAATFDPTAIVIFGGGGHGKTIIDLIRASGAYRIVGIFDDRLPVGSEVLNIPVLGGAKNLPEWHDRGITLAANAVGGIGNVDVRIKVFDLLSKAGFAFPALIHPTAVIERSATIDAGVQVLAHAYIGTECRVGFGSVLNVGAIVSHDCVIGRVVNMSPGATLAGGVRVEDFAQIGMRATVNVQVTVGSRALLGNGCTVKAEVPPGTRVYAGTVWPPYKPKPAA